jgi:hypothetical protein
MILTREEAPDKNVETSEEEIPEEDKEEDDEKHSVKPLVVKRHGPEV